MIRCIAPVLAFVLSAGTVSAQMPFGAQAPQAPPDPAVLFKNQCGTCHTTDASAPPRQGPHLAGVVGRKAGTLPGFKYSAGFAGRDLIWDEAELDRWLTNPQAMIPGAVMVYRQANPGTRHAIIGWLKEQH